MWTVLRAAPLIFRQTTACVANIDGLSSRKVLQTDGYVDDVVRISVCTITEDGSLPSAAGFAVTPLSSNTEVLPLDNIDLRTVVAPLCLNVTALLIFDAMVGTVTFTISARSGSSAACTASVSYIVAGLTVYNILNDAVSDTRTVSQGRHISLSRSTVVPSKSDPGIRYLVRSGFDNVIVRNFRDVLNNPIDYFRVRVQFPDGSSSMTKPLSDTTTALRSVRARVPVDASSPLRFGADQCSIIASDDVDDTLRDGELCGVALGLRDELLFGIRYLPYKDGIGNISLTWPTFTFNDDVLSDEEFYTTVALSIVGDPPPLVEKLAAPDVMYRAGGQLISIVFDNAEGSSNRVLRLGKYSFPEVDGSFQLTENGLYKAQFRTLPGSGTEIPWRLEVSYDQKESKLSTTVEEDIRRNLSYVTEPLRIGSLQPPWGSDEEVLTIEGFFDGFDPSKDGHSIFIGNKSLNELGIVPTVDRERGTITLTAPNRSVAGSAYEYPIRVIVNNESTEGFIFAYVPDKFTMTINVYGGSYDSERGEYLLGTCEFSQYLAVLSSGVTEPRTFRWTLLTRIDGVVVDLLEEFSELSERNSSLTLQASVFRGRVGVFVLSASCIIYGQAVVADVTLRKTMNPVIGVTLPALPIRSLMVPDLPVRIDAIVTLPDHECYRLWSNVVYVWTYNNISSIFSYSNVSAIDVSLVREEDRVRPTRLGRELLIPQSQLVYGNLTISLLVYVDDDSFISGKSSTTLEVSPAPLQPIIGFGATKITHSSAKDLNITAARSKNPDGPLDPTANITRYTWECELSFDQNQNNPGFVEPCLSDLLPARNIVSFVVQSRIFQSGISRATSLYNISSFNVIYSLKVGTSGFTSSPVFLQVEVTDSNQNIASLSDLTVMNGRGTMVDLERIRYHEDMVFAPNGVNVTWSFHVISPRLDAHLFDSVDNLIISDGYYNPQLHQPQSLPIGIKAGALKPSRIYDIALYIRSIEDGIGNGTVLIQLRTVDAPKLLLSPLTLTTGDTNTVFTAAARVNLDSQDSFSFFFFLVTSDGDEICLNGCSGRSVVQFVIVEDGQFRILVRLRDVQGTFVLDEQFFPINISITSLGGSASQFVHRSSLDSFDTLLNDMYRYGDHGAVQLLSSVLARRARSLTNSDFLENTVTMIFTAIQFMRGIVYNSVPTVFTSRSYIQTANLFARLPSNLIQDHSLSALLAMVDDALMQVPVTEALDVDQELLMFYNLTARHYLRPFVSVLHGVVVPSRHLFPDSQHRSGRLPSERQVRDSRMTDQTSLTNFFVFMQKHFSLTLSRDTVCGSTKSVSTAVKSGIADRNAFRDNTAKDDMPQAWNAFRFVESFGRFQIPLSSTISIAVVCNSAQTNRLNGKRSQLSWRESSVEDGKEDDAEEEEIKIPKMTPGSTDDYSVSESPNPLIGSTIRLDGVSGNLMPSEVRTQKQLIIMMETMDYIWVAGLVEEDMRTETSILITMNSTKLSGNFLTSSTLMSNQFYVINTTIPRVGSTEGGGCIGAQGFYEEGHVYGKVQLDASQQYERRFGLVSADMSTDNSSTILMRMERVGIVGAVLTNCPRDAQLPSIALPRAEIEFPYGVIGVAITVSTAITIGWTSSSASYASFTGSAVWK